MKEVCLKQKDFDKLLSLSLKNCRKSPKFLPVFFPNINQPILPSSLVLEYDTNKAINDYEYTIDLTFLGKYNNIDNIDWGDGSNFTNSQLTTPAPSNYIHTYTDKRIYTVIINGVENVRLGYGEGNKPIRQLITKIIQFPNNCKSIICDDLSLLESVPEFLPTSVDNLNTCFYSCSIFNQNLNSWDVSNVTDMGYMFANCINFNNGDEPGQSNKPLNWNVENVKDMSFMFWLCSSFNQDISNWNIKSVTNVYSMLNMCTSFRQDLRKWLDNINKNIPDKTNNNRDIFVGCNPGTYIYQDILCLPCPDGTYSGTNYPKCLVCPDGTYSFDSRQCNFCPMNSYCTKGLKKPCPQNTHSYIGAKTCLPN
jgi:surface protein